MRKILFFLLILGFCSDAHAYRQVFNHNTGRLDYVGVGASADIVVSCDSGQTLTSSGGGVWACGTSSGGSGAPADAQYYTAASNATLTNEVVVTKSGVGSRMITGVSPFTSGRISYFDVNGDLQASSVTSADATAVTLAGANYLTLSGQQITAGDVALGTHTSGNYVANVATTSPITGGSAGSEGASLTIAIPAANATTNGYMPSTSMASIDTLIVGTVDGTPDTDHSANGEKTSTFNAGATITVMDLVYLGSSSKWLLTDADSASTSGGVMLAISLESKTDTQAMSVALPGSFVRDDTWNWTPGAVLYVDTATAGGITATQPSGTDDVIRVVGFAVTADVIYFDPSADYITHV